MSSSKAPSPNELLGSVVGDTYILVAFIGNGSFGSVFRAIDTSTPERTEVAVKALHRAEPGTPQWNRQVLECHAHYKCTDHPNVLPMRNVILDDHYIFIVLELCAGGDLRNFIGNRPFVWRNDEWIKSVFLQMIDAVESCHQKNVFHCDLKPGNILCSEDGSQVFITDFGLASLSEEAMSGTGGGTYSYMSPEAIGEEFKSMPYSTADNDIWALGIILINLCTAHLPWTYAIPEDTSYNDFVQNATTIYRNLPISKALAAFIVDILDPKPATRLTLNDMRRMVKRIDTFFPTDEELALAPQKIRDMVVPYVEGGEKALPKCTIPDVSTTWEEGLFREGLKGNIAEPDHRLDKYQPRGGSSSRSSSFWSDSSDDSTDDDDASGSDYSHSMSSSSCHRPLRHVVNPDAHSSGSESSEPELEREHRSESPESDRGPTTPSPPPMGFARPIQTGCEQGKKANREDEEDELWKFDVTAALEEMAHIVRALPAVAISSS